MLIKNFYSRVGTKDWESIMTAQARKDMLNTDLYSMCIIGEKEQLNQMKIFLKFQIYIENRLAQKNLLSLDLI